MTEVLYLVGLRVYERKAYPDWRKWLPLRPGEPLSAESTAIAAEILDEIEEAAGGVLAELPEEVIDAYQEKLRRISDRARPPSTPERIAAAERLLEELRRDYARPEERNVV